MKRKQLFSPNVFVSPQVPQRFISCIVIFYLLITSQNHSYFIVLADFRFCCQCRCVLSFLVSTSVLHFCKPLTSSPFICNISVILPVIVAGTMQQLFSIKTIFNTQKYKGFYSTLPHVHYNNQIMHYVTRKCLFLTTQAGMT